MSRTTKTVFEELTEAQLLEYARSSYINAQEARRDLEDTRVIALEQYRTFRKELADGGRSFESKGQFGWSKLEVPIVFWVVETILPRLVLNAPTIIVKADSPSAVPYATVKQMRIQRQMHRARMVREMVRAIKQMLIYSDGPVKTTWNTHEARPNFQSINWFDFYLSAGAARHWDAEWVFHRTWYTPHDIVQLAQLVDSKGKALYKNLDQAISQGGSGEANDRTLIDRQQATDLGAWTWHGSTNRIDLIECWHRDGTLVTLGPSGEVLLRATIGPNKLPTSYEDAQPPDDPNEPFEPEPDSGRAWRPFAMFGNTPDLEGPYGISDAYMQQDYQREASTIRRQATDQAAANIHAPIAYNSDVVGTEVDRAFARPGGKIRVNGNVETAIKRLLPGQVSGDTERMMEMIRSESQLVSGISDFSAGQRGGAGLNDTATGVVKTIEEANQRWLFKQRLLEEDMGDVACMIDWLDRQYGGKLAAQHDPTRDRLEGQEGYEELGPKLVMLGTDANKPGAEYQVTVAAGSLTPASKREESQNVIALIGAIAGSPMEERVDWDQLTREVISAHGLDPERIFTGMQMMPPPPPGADPAMNGAGGGLEPVGAPIPIG